MPDRDATTLPEPEASRDPSAPRLPRAFYRRPAITVARSLLGQRLVRIVEGRRLSGIIVETEAYLGPRDKAAHTFGNRRSPRNNSMWLDGGSLYVYFTYGMHFCMNVVAGVVEEPIAVLIRAIEPTEGLDQIKRRRPAARRESDLCSGPGKLCQALAIDRALDGSDLCTSSLIWIEQLRRKSLPSNQIAVGPRVGVAYAGEWAAKPLRFSQLNNPHVSRPWPTLTGPSKT